MKKVWKLTGEVAKKAACREVLSAPEGHVVTLAEPTRSLEQNAKLWASLSDLAMQTDWHGIKLTQEEWKDLLSAGLVKAKVVPNMDGNGFVVLGQRTSRMSKQEFGDLLELISAFGTERGVRWSEPGLYKEVA